MNNFQNSFGKCVSPPITQANHSEAYRPDEKKPRNNETRPVRALSIFYESKHFHLDEPRPEWSFSNSRKKHSRLGTLRAGADGKKSWKNERKTKNEEYTAEEKYKKACFLTAIESQVSKTKPRGQNSKLGQKHEIIITNTALQKTDWLRSRDIPEKFLGSIEPERPVLSSLFTLPRSKVEAEKKVDKTDIKPRGFPFSTNKSLSRKTPDKMSNHSTEMTATISDSGKRRINEILKSHAQKIQSTSAKTMQIKDYTINVLDPQKKGQNNSVDVKESKNATKADKTDEIKQEATKTKPDKTDEVKQEATKTKPDKTDEVKQEATKTKPDKTDEVKQEATKTKPDKTDEVKQEATKTNPDKTEEVQQEATKTKSIETTEETKEKSKEPKEKGVSEDKTEEKKKLPGIWLKLPQSNELERRLKNSWHESNLFSKDLKGDRSFDDEKVSNPSEDETKSEKRVTYTDRLLLLKMLGKSLEDRKQNATAVEMHLKESGNLTKAPPKENSETLQKKTEKALLPLTVEVKPLLPPVMKDLVTTDKKSFSSLKDSRFMETDRVYKTKQTRSTELRDLVAQAIREHKIFCIFDNHTYIVRPVREELLSRGWLEVIPDRRFIPRRRPPPMGPIYERDRTMNERNCNTLEAILAAKETFADEIQNTVSRSSFRFPIEKPKIIASSIVAVNKKSEESLTETLSLFRIIPPTSEKKKTNTDIREFVVKYQAYAEKEKEREKEIRNLREKEKNAKLNKKDRFKLSTQVAVQKVEEKALPEGDKQRPLGNNSLQEIWDSINDNKKMIMQATSEIKSLEATAGGKVTLGVLYESTQNKIPAIEEKKEEGSHSKTKIPTTNTTLKNVFSEGEAKTISKIIQSSNARIHFMWLSIKPGIHLKCFNYSPEIVNKFQKTTFCTKIGLWSHLNNMQWYAHEVSHPAKSPRMYNTGEADDMQAFFQDFRLTACIGMLKWLSDTFFERGLKGVQTKKGKVPLRAFEFAIKQCEKYVRFKENEELNMPEEATIHQEEWNTFLQWFYIITNDHGKVQESSSAQLMVVYTKAVDTLKLMKRHWPEIDIDGRLNIWIMKPYCASCGRGIFMTNNVYYISQHSKYIVQKYIEKPLLIYNTKFDIRQWFMITKLTPLEIWMYKECYLRFCSQPFALRNLHESVHLSNNSVQRKYISVRDPNLPDQNMWDSNTFQLYLKTIGHPNVWDEVIYPGMRDAIVSTMLAAQDTFDGPRKSWFEVYGADFMLSANVKEGPWLIEINENPAMDPSTKVTARLCPQMLRDVIKVVVDKRANKNASTGQWELIYRQNYSPSFGTVDLDVRGKKIARVPFTTKVSFNIPQNFPRGTKICDSKTIGLKLYELVKTFGAVQNPKKGLTTEERKIENS